MLDCQLFGLNPAGPHAVNILLHLANTLLIFMVLLEMTEATWRSAFVAALFPLHPMHVETVAWGTDRKDLLSTFFMLLTLLVYTRYTERPSPGKYLLALTFFAMGLLAKSMLVMLPAMLILLAYWPLGRLPVGQSNEGLRSRFSLFLKGRVLKEKIPFFLLSMIDGIIILYVTHSRLSGKTATFVDNGSFLSMNQNGLSGKLSTFFPSWARLLHAVSGYATYVKRLFWPMDLSVA